MSRFNRYYLLLAFLSITYCASILIIPPNASVMTRYAISATHAKMLSLSIALPLIGIWFTAFYGFIRLKQYASHAQPDKDGEGLAKIANGLMFLAVAMPVNSLGAAISNYAATSRPHLTAVFVIIHNYVALLLVLTGFYFINKGASRLVSLLSRHSRYSSREQLIVILFFAISAAFSYLTLTNPVRQFPTGDISRAAYYMADFPLVLTIVIPYLFVWFFGIQSVYFIYLFSNKVKGVLYKNALTLLVFGLGTVVAASMAIRFLVSLTTLLNHLTLKTLLITLYVLVIALIIGNILIARGVRNLQRIEEV